MVFWFFFWNGEERNILLSYHLIVGTNPLWIGRFVRIASSSHTLPFSARNPSPGSVELARKTGDFGTVTKPIDAIYLRELLESNYRKLCDAEAIFQRWSGFFCDCLNR